MQGAVFDLGVDNAAKHHRTESERKANWPSAETVIYDHQRSSEHNRDPNSRAHLRSLNNECECDGERSDNHRPDYVKQSIFSGIVLRLYTRDQTGEKDHQGILDDRVESNRSD